MGRSKVVYFGETLMDLTGDTVAAENLLQGATAHGADGEPVVGACTFDADTQDATAAQAEILQDKTAYVRGSKLSGTMPNNGAVSGVITERDGKYTVPQGYHDGSGGVQIDATEREKLIPGNIKAGVTILGIEGTHEGSSAVTAQTKSATPSNAEQTVLPDEGYDYLSQVTIAAIPYTETENSAGGITVTIG